MTKTESIFVGQTFGRWVVVGPLVKSVATGQSGRKLHIATHRCECSCGVTRDVLVFKLLSNSRSCGCLKAQSMKDRARHGLTSKMQIHPLYVVWRGMVNRCTNKNSKQFKDYGGRGIQILWRSPESFVAWATENGYQKGKQIERRDNDGPYSSENCTWASAFENSRNKRTTRNITAFGETKCLTDWGLDPRCSVSPPTILYRIDRGMTAEDAITTERRSRADAPKWSNIKTRGIKSK